MSKKNYYHGSPTEIKDLKLQPRPSAVLNGESAVFATKEKMIALLFMSKWTDADLGFGFYKSVPYLEEIRPGAFAEIFQNKSGWLYEVDKDLFETDSRLGMINHEFVSKTSVPILKRTYIQNIATEIKEAGLQPILFEERMSCLWSGGYIQSKAKKYIEDNESQRFDLYSEVLKKSKEFFVMK